MISRNFFIVDKSAAGKKTQVKNDSAELLFFFTFGVRRFHNPTNKITWPHNQERTAFLRPKGVFIKRFLTLYEYCNQLPIMTNLKISDLVLARIFPAKVIPNIDHEDNDALIIASDQSVDGE
jgi:hypothetical protein